MDSKHGRTPKPATTSSTLEGQLLNIDAVALALGVTRRHVQRLVAERRIPFLKVGRFVRFDRTSLNLWLDQQRVDPVRTAGQGFAQWR